jgi:hypothetical protein
MWPFRGFTVRRNSRQVARVNLANLSATRGQRRKSAKFSIACVRRGALIFLNASHRHQVRRLRSGLQRATSRAEP